MAVSMVQVSKCTPAQCRNIAKQAYSIHALLKDEPELKRRALVFQALGNETRLRILAMLSVQELCTCDIVEAVGVAATTLAYHLKMLEEAGLIQSRQVSRFTLYTLIREPVEKHQVFT